MSRDKGDTTSINLCLCGCGQRVFGWNHKLDQPIRYKKGHYARDANPNWKGGRTLSNGYIVIHRPNHHRAKRSRGHVYEHIIIYEETHKCCMLSWGDVHHINGIKTDNRPENLMGMTHSTHLRIETTGRKMSKETIEKRRRTRLGSRYYPR